MSDKMMRLTAIGDSSGLFALDKDFLLGVEGSSGTPRPRGVLGQHADSKSLIYVQMVMMAGRTCGQEHNLPQLIGPTQSCLVLDLAALKA
jgi:hypothetical protein